MAAELIDLRLKITAETAAVLDAHARAAGVDKAEVARKVLHEWAERKIVLARYIFGSVDGLTLKKATGTPDRLKAV